MRALSVHTRRPITKLPALITSSLNFHSASSLAARTPALAHILHVYIAFMHPTQNHPRVSLGCDVGDDDGGGGDAINKTAAFELDKIYAANGGSTRAPCLSFRAGAAFACLRARARVCCVERGGGRISPAPQLFVFLIDG
jgi:hypothetical protein